MLTVSSVRRPIFPLVDAPLRALGNAVLFAVFFVLIVFGTYGTHDGGLEVTGDTYLHIAYPATVIILSAMLCWRWIIRGGIELYAFRLLEGQLLLLYLGIMLVSLLASPNKILSVSVTILSVVVTVLLVSNIVDRKERFYDLFKFVCFLIYLTAMIAFAIGAYTYWVDSVTIGPLLIEYNKIFWRVNSWFITSTAFGLFMSYGVVSVLYFISTSYGNVARLVHMMSIIVLFVGMSIAGARTSFVVLAVALIVLAGARASLRRKYIVAVFFSVIVLVLLLLLVLSYQEELYIIRRFIFSDDTVSLGGRLGMWNYAIENWGDRVGVFRLLFGSGLGTYSQTMGISIAAHSGLLRMMIEHGLLGLVVFLCFALLVLGRAVLMVHRSCNPEPEKVIFLMLIVIFFFAETVIDQLLGISMDSLLFISLISLYLSLRRIENKAPQQNLWVRIGSGRSLSA